MQAAIGCGGSLVLDYVGEQLGSHTKTAGDISLTGRDVVDALAANSWWGFIFCLLFGIFETREAYLKYRVGNWP